MKSVTIKNRLFAPYVLIFCMLSITINSQDGSKDELEAQGSIYFLQGDYDKAMVSYQSLHDLYPKDAEICYYLGRCYLNCNQNVEEAAKLLKFAAIRNFGEDAYFFLGRAYHLNYQFDEADMAFNTFTKMAKSKYVKEYDVNYWIEANRNAKKSVTAVLKTPLVKKTLVPAKVTESAFSENTNGKYIYVPDEFRSATDKSKNYQTLMFVSKDIQVDDYLYFDTKSLKLKSGTDIYRVKRLQNDEYSIPERLPDIINTAYDEAYPYYDKGSSTLYFSSKGLNTSGGFDIFYSKFDEDSKKWSTPEKLEFPINTPYDDYLYTIDPEKKNVTFLSNRNSGIGSINAYTLPTLQGGEYLSLWSKDEIKKYAEFENAEFVTEHLALNDQKEKIDNEIPEQSVVITPTINNTDNSGTKNEYDMVLAEALSLQSHCDSLIWCVKDLKRQALSENNYQKKQQMLSNASILDKEAQRVQTLASSKFLLAEKLRGETPNTNLAMQNQPQKPEPMQQDITVIAFPEENIELKKSQNNQSVENDSYTQGYNAATQVAVPQIAEGFRIEKTSPYSKDNPIPFQAKLPDGLIYRIQLGAYSGVIEENAFKGLTPVTAEKTANKDITKYYVGYFPTIEVARKALGEVKSYGYPDAFLVSYYNKEKITIQKAREIEFAEK